MSLRVIEPRQAQTRTQVQISISKRVEPRAVRRNRAKRLVREVFRKESLAPLIYRIKIEKMPSEQTYAEFERAIAGLLK